MKIELKKKAETFDAQFKTIKKRNMRKKRVDTVKNKKRVQLKEEGKVMRIVVKVATKKVKEVMKVVKNQINKS